MRGVGASASVALLTLSCSLLVSTTFGEAYEIGKVPNTPVDLTKENFKNAIQDPANPFWLLKFYAPWCGHCKKLAPVLDSVASRVVGSMAIGKIDCTSHKKLCDEFSVRGYPTLKFSVDGEIHDYPGGRSEAELLAFSKKMSRDSVQLMNSEADAFQYAKEQTDDGVAFLAYHHAVNGDSLEDKIQSTLLTQVYAQVARKFKAVGHFLLLAPGKDASPRQIAALGKEGPFICRIEANVDPRCYDKISDITMPDLLTFVREQNVATVSALGPQNFNKVGRNGRPLVIGVIDTKDDEQVTEVRRVLAEYATKGPESIRDKYYYAYFDGKTWQRFLEQFNVKPGEMPQVFVLDVVKKVFWQNATYKLNVDDFLADLHAGAIKKDTTGKKGMEGALHRLYYAMVEYRPWSVVFAVIVVISIGVVIASCVSPGEELRPPYPRTEQGAPAKTTDETDEREEKAEVEAETKKDK